MNATITPQSRLNPLSWMRKLFSPAASARSNVDSRAAAIPVSPAPRLNKTILLVDDDPVFLRATSMQLNAGGYDVVTAADGAEAIRAARKQRPHLVVLDINLPLDVTGVAWNGFRVVTWLQRFDELKGIPVVIVTSGDPQKYTREAFGVGARGFFHKRMDPNHLMTLVGHTLNRPAAPEAKATANFQI